MNPSEACVNGFYFVDCNDNGSECITESVSGGYKYFPCRLLAAKNPQPYSFRYAVTA